LIFRGTFESSAELFDFPRDQITTSEEEKIVQKSFAVDSDFLNRLVAGPRWTAVVFSMSESSEIGSRDRNWVFSVYTVFAYEWHDKSFWLAQLLHLEFDRQSSKIVQDGEPISFGLFLCRRTVVFCRLTGAICSPIGAFCRARL